MNRNALAASLIGVLFVSMLEAQGGDPAYRPKRINKMIELLEAGQPVYDVSVQGVGYEEGKKLAQSHVDMIQYIMEHGPFEPMLLRQFMQGLVDGGPTKSGHRTPTVIVNLPVLGLDETSVRVNHWVIEQVLSAGVHGLMLCHARNAEAVRMFVASARYQFERAELKGADKGIPEGLRGSGSGLPGLEGALPAWRRRAKSRCVQRDSFRQPSRVSIHRRNRRRDCGSHPRLSVEDESIDVRTPRGVERELNMHVVVRVIR